MFGCLVAGRLVQTDMQQVDPTHFVFNIENANTVNHIVVFLTGAMPFPEGMSGAIHFSWPSPEGVAWKYLGYITNEKPSAIFKISGLKKGTISTNNPFMLAGQQMNTVSQIGIAVEPTAQIAQQIPTDNTQTSNVSNFTEFTQKMLENFYNYASSFGISQAQMTPQPEVSWVPISVLDKWYENFSKKLSQDVNFWKS